MKLRKHTGFDVDSGRSVPPENRAEREQLCQDVLRNRFSSAKATLEYPPDTFIYRSRLNPKINRVTGRIKTSHRGSKVKAPGSRVAQFARLDWPLVPKCRLHSTV